MVTSGTIRAVAVIALAFGLSVADTTAWAHHSFSQFDSDKTLSVEGTVKDFTWSNPHVWIDLMVADAVGRQQQWGLESQSVGILHRGGWNPDSLKPGDKVTIQIHPMKDGTTGGQVMTVTFPDGHVLRTGMARPNPG